MTSALAHLMPDHFPMTELLQANLHLLDQMSELLSRLDDRSYRQTSPVFINSSIGGHVRHCLEHYQCFAEGLPHARVNYDLRQRDAEVETQPAAALARLSGLRSQLTSLFLNDHTEAILVLMDHGAAAHEGCWQESSPGRELQFLISHTIHHFALIAGLCRTHGVDIAPTFGVAPSTLRHRAAH
jgi:uncharacterized damage-inducible protein DinB